MAFICAWHWLASHSSPFSQSVIKYFALFSITEECKAYFSAAKESTIFSYQNRLEKISKSNLLTQLWYWFYFRYIIFWYFKDFRISRTTKGAYCVLIWWWTLWLWWPTYTLTFKWHCHCKYSQSVYAIGMTIKKGGNCLPIVLWSIFRSSSKAVFATQ